jgi:hypothetical protein
MVGGRREAVAAYAQWSRERGAVIDRGRDAALSIDEVLTRDVRSTVRGVAESLYLRPKTRRTTAAVAVAPTWVSERTRRRRRRGQGSGLGVWSAGEVRGRRASPFACSRGSARKMNEKISVCCLNPLDGFGATRARVNDTGVSDRPWHRWSSLQRAFATDSRANSFCGANARRRGQCGGRNFA